MLREHPKRSTPNGHCHKLARIFYHQLMTREPYSVESAGQMRSNELFVTVGNGNGLNELAGTFLSIKP